MKVCVDLTSLADNFSGIERYAASLTKELIQDKSVEYTLLFKNEVHAIFRNPPENVNTVVIPGCNKLWFNQIRLPYAIHKIRADCYLFLAFPVPVLTLKKNMVSTIHDICCWDCPETMNKLSKWYFRISHRFAVKKCRAIITISEFSKQRIVDKLSLARDRIWLVYCGIDEKFLNYRQSDEEDSLVREKYDLPKEYILSLSTLEPRKNLGLLIDAYTQLISDNEISLPLVLAGRKGWKMDEVLSKIDQSVRDKILFTGFIDDDDLPAVYGNSSLFVFPSLYEGFGLPPLEALSCGATVLSSNAASLPEVLGDGASYFESNDMADLASMIKKLQKGNKTQKGHTHPQYLWDVEAVKLKHYLEVMCDGEGTENF